MMIVRKVIYVILMTVAVLAALVPAICLLPAIGVFLLARAVYEPYPPSMADGTQTQAQRDWLKRWR